VEADAAARWRERALATVAHVAEAFDAHGIAVAGDLGLTFDALRELAIHGRRPRVAAVGRRGAAKSSLLNALANEPRAVLGDVEDATRVIHWSVVSWGVHEVLYADTPGLRASGRSRRTEEISRAFAASPPDVLLVLCHATEVDAGIDDDLADVRAIVDARRDGSDAAVIVGVVTRVDELDPPHVIVPPYDDREKQQQIVHATQLFAHHLTRARLDPVRVIPVSTYVRFDAMNAPRDDLRWNLDALVAVVDAFLPDPLERRLLAAREARALVTAAMDGLVEAIATRVGHGADDVAARELLVRALRGLAPFPSRAGDRLDVATERAAPLGWASDALTAVGASRFGAAAAAARIRAMGRGLRDQLLEQIDDEEFAALAG
jgi:predicted GTPase